MSAELLGPIDMHLVRDKDGYRDYTIVWKIRTTSYDDGPQVVLNCPTLPDIGTTWSFGNDLDDWVWCIPDTRVQPFRAGNPDDPVRYWTLEQTFTNRAMKRCQDFNIENPLDEPPAISGSFVKYTEEVRYDRHGKVIKTSSHEPIVGPDSEFDRNRPTVSIEMNKLTLDLDDVSSMVDTVNDAPLWGLSARKIKLSNVSWSRKLYGICTFYYTVSLEFDINFDTFDRIITDVGTRHINPDMIKPDSGWFPTSLLTEFKDAQGNIQATFDPPQMIKDIPLAFTKILDGKGREAGWTVLNGEGVVAKDPESAGEVSIEYYPESNFLTLGIPTSL